MSADQVPQRRARRGGNAIEFALVVPVFVAILAGIVDYGWYQQQQALVAASVRRAARAGSAADETVDPTTTAKARLDDELEQYGLALGSQTIEIRGTTPDQAVYVETRIPYEPLIGLLPVPGQHVAGVAMRLEVQGR